MLHFICIINDNMSILNRLSSSKKQIIGLVAIAIVFTAAPVMAQSTSAQGFIPELLHNSLQWIEDKEPAGAIAFILIYIIATVAFIPSSILTLGAGVVFGVVLGSIYTLIGATIGATAAFLVGRYLIRGWISKKIAGNDKFKAIDKAVAKEGFKIVFLARLSPVLPFIVLNYAFGVSGVSLRDYFLGSIGMIPATITYVYIGSLAGSLATIGKEQPTNPALQWAIRIISLIATVAVTIYITRVARKALECEVSSNK